MGLLVPLNQVGVELDVTVLPLYISGSNLALLRPEWELTAPTRCPDHLMCRHSNPVRPVVATSASMMMMIAAISQRTGPLIRVSVGHDDVKAALGRFRDLDLDFGIDQASLELLLKLEKGAGQEMVDVLDAGTKTCVACPPNIFVRT